MSVRRSMGERRKMPIRKELATIADLETGARVIPSGSDLYRQGDIYSTYYVVLSGWSPCLHCSTTALARFWISHFRARYLGFSLERALRCITPPVACRSCASMLFHEVGWTQSSKAIHASLFCSAAKSPAMRHAPTIISPTLGCEGQGSASRVSCSRSM